MAAPGLGDFAKLPVEIRLLIWAEFSPSGQKRGKTDLAILRTSKQIHEEVLHCIYENVSILAFLIKAKFDDGYHYGETASYLSFDIWGGSALLQSVGNNNDDSDSDNEGDELELVAGAQRWRFSSAQDALSRGFEYLPLDKMPTVISIEAPDPNDPGQLIRLCLRIQQVVKLLKSLKKPIYKVVIRFGDPRDWMQKKGEGSEESHSSEGEEDVVEEQQERAEKEKKEKLQFSLEQMGYPGLTFIQTDIEAVLFPFYSLDNVKHFIFNTATTKLLFPNSKMDLDFLPATDIETSRVKLRDLCLYKLPADLEGWNDMYNYYLHTRLDFVEGETASLLRVDRFALWEEQKYDEMFLRLVKKYPIQIDALDVNGLEGLKTRYIYAHTARYYVTRQDIKDLPTDIDLRTLAPNLPPEEWGEVFGVGLPPLERDRFTDEFGEDFWLEFKIYAKKWSLSQWDLREQQQQKQSPDLQGLDAFASAVSDAQGEWEQMITYHPDIEQRLVDEFGLRRYEIGE